MELSKMSYFDIQRMPVQMLTDYINWKIKYDDEVEKAKQKAIDSIRTNRRKR